MVIYVSLLNRYSLLSSMFVLLILNCLCLSIDCCNACLTTATRIYYSLSSIRISIFSKSIVCHFVSLLFPRVHFINPDFFFFGNIDCDCVSVHCWESTRVHFIDPKLSVPEIGPGSRPRGDFFKFQATLSV